MKTISLDNLHECSLQEVYKFVASHLLIQNKKSLSIRGKCLHKDQDGNRCAIGCLVGDRAEEFDNYDLIWTDLVRRKNLTDNHQYELGKLQRIHDSKKVEDWKDELKQFGEEQGLDTNFLGEF